MEKKGFYVHRQRFTYDLKPEMSAYEIRDAIVPELQKGNVDFVCLNFANGDMVGHRVFEVAVKARETVDACAKDVVTTGLENGYTTLLIADHGNCETMINSDGTLIQRIQRIQFL